MGPVVSKLRQNRSLPGAVETQRIVDSSAVQSDEQCFTNNPNDEKALKVISFSFPVEV